MTSEQIRKHLIERFVMLRQILFTSCSASEISDCDEEMVVIKKKLGMTTNQILHERNKALQELEDQSARNLQWGRLFDPRYANDIGAL